MGKRLGIRAAAVAAVAAAGLGVALLAGGDSPPAMVTDPHGGSLSRDRLAKILLAAADVNQSASKAELEARGQRLFENPAVAKTGESCATCHVLGGAVNDAIGVIPHVRTSDPVTQANFTGKRQPPTLWDVGSTAPYNWTGSAPTLESQVVMAIRTHFTDENPKDSDVAAVAAYLRTLHAPVTRQDQGRLTPEEIAGEEVFVGKGGCIACHGGPQFTDNLIHDTDVKRESGDSDPGAIPGTPEGFNTPTLRDIRNTAPYMHNGTEKTLADVVRFYNDNTITAGPLGLQLTADEMRELVAYLKTL